MRLVECLNRADPAHLRAIAMRHGLTCPTHSKHALLQEILSRLSAASYIRRRLVEQPRVQALACELCLTERSVFGREELCAVLLRALGRASGEKASVLARATGDLSADSTSLASAAQAVEELMHEGLLFAVPVRGQVLYHAPEDVWKRVRACALEQLSCSVQATQIEPVTVRYDHHALAQDALSTLQFTLHHSVKLTQSGTIFRRQQQQLFELFEVPEQPLAARRGWHVAYGRRFADYPARFALIYDHLVDSGCLIETSEGSLVCAPDTVEMYAKRPENERMEALYMQFIRDYQVYIPNLRAIVARVEALCARGWIFAHSLEDALAGTVVHAPEPAATTLSERILPMLVALGKLTVGTNADGTILYRVPHAPEEGVPEGDRSLPRATVLPTFDILVPRLLESHCGWELRRIAEPLPHAPADPLRVYRITRQSVGRACASGQDERTILATLEQRCTAPTPENVRRTICDWGRQFRRYRIERRVLIVCSDQEAADELAALPPIACRLAERDGRLLAFANGEEEALSNLLMTLGYR